MTVQMKKRLEFDAGHRLMNHESKCRNLHGHRYAVEVTLCLRGELDAAGRVIDFGAVKRLLGSWIDDQLDHGFICNEKDEPVISFLKEAGSKVFVMDAEPSAENLAVLLLEKAKSLLDDERCFVSSVVVYETPTSSAEAQ